MVNVSVGWGVRKVITAICEKKSSHLTNLTLALLVVQATNMGYGIALRTPLHDDYTEMANKEICNVPCFSNE